MRNLFGIVLLFFIQSIVSQEQNTEQLYKEAIDAGFDALELDILQTKDGELICSHNFDLERESNGVGWVQHTNYNKLKDLQTGVYTHPQNTQTIARLQDVLDEIPKNIFLLMYALTLLHLI